MNRVFVYKTLMHEKIMQGALHEQGLHKRLFDAVLPNYKKLDKFKDYYTLIPADGEQVVGKSTLLTDAELAKLDSWEARYNRKRVKLQDGNWAWAYFLKPGER